MAKHYVWVSSIDHQRANSSCHRHHFHRVHCHCLHHVLCPKSNLLTVSRLYRGQPEQDEEENGDIRARNLSQGPPPAYRNANQYQNVDLEHTKVVKSTVTYRVPTNSEVETTSLPPDYTSQRLSISVAPQEIQASKGQQPPTYSTAQLELMARRTAAAVEQQGNSHLTYS